MRKPAPLALIAAFLLGTGCMGTRPQRFGPSSLGFGAVIIRCRLILPDGETRLGGLHMNLEAENGEAYRLRTVPDETTLYRVEPDRYRLHPTRSLFGFVQNRLKVHIADQTYSLPFPRSLLRKDPIEVKPRKIVPIGILEARLLPIRRGREPRVEVRLDDSIATRRKLVEDLIKQQMDHRTPIEIRDKLISWTRALEQALIRVQGEEERRPSFKRID